MRLIRPLQVSPAPRRANIAPWQYVLVLLMSVALHGATVSSVHTSAAAPLAQALAERLSLATGHEQLRSALSGDKQGCGDGADNSPDSSSPVLNAAPQLPVVLAATSALLAPAAAAALLSRHYRLALARAPPLA